MSAAWPWDYRLARKIAAPIAAAGIQPNTVTTFGLVMGIGAGVLFAVGGHAAANWAALMFVIAVFTDHVDGEVARLARKASLFGHFYDHTAAALSYAAVFIGAGIAVRNGPYGAWSVAAGLSAGLSVLGIMFIRLKVSIERGADSIRQPVFLGFEPEDTLYAVGPVVWIDGFTPYNELLTFIMAAGLGTPVYMLRVFLQARREAPHSRSHAAVDSKPGS